MVPPLVLLALLTRQRQELVEAGELSRRQLYDLRTFKSVLVVLEQLRRLAAVERSGTFATSMGQLVAGQAKNRPGWTMDGERFSDRDRHQSRMREWLDVLEECGVLRWRAGWNLEEEPARTEIRLRPAPEVSPEELDQARERLRAWKRRYGPALNTGSSTGVRGAARRGKPLSAEQAADRGRARCTKKALASRQGFSTVPAPPFGASTTSQNSRPSATPRDTLGDLSSHAPKFSDAYGTTTGVMRAHAPEDSSCSGAAASPEGAAAVAALEPPENGIVEDGGLGSSRARAGASEGPHEPVPGDLRPGGARIDLSALLERVRAREAALAESHGMLADAIRRRALQLAQWPADRPVPVARLKEAWAAAIAGPLALAQAPGPAPAAAASREDLARLQRARRRYADHADHRPEHLPEHPLAALLALTAAAAAAGTPAGRTLKGAIWALDRLTKRMRATAAVHDPKHQAKARARAARRQDQRAAPPAGRISFRLDQPWPTWIKLDDHGDPLFVDGVLQLDEDWAPPAWNAQRRLWIRDAHLLTGRPLDVRTDGRLQMDYRERIDPFDVSVWEQRRRDAITPELLHFVNRTKIALDTAREIPADRRAEILEDLERARTARRDHDRDQFRDQLDRT